PPRCARGWTRPRAAGRAPRPRRNLRRRGRFRPPSREAAARTRPASRSTHPGRTARPRPTLRRPARGSTRAPRGDRRARRAERGDGPARTPEAVPERRQVARRAGADREAREQAWEIGNLAERRGEALEARRVLLELLDAIEPRFDAGAAAERPFEEPAEGTSFGAREE